MEMAGVALGAIGLLVTVVGLVVAVVALRRTAPTFSIIGPKQGRYTLSHTGPGNVVVRRIWVEDPGGEFPVNTERSGVEMYEGEGFPFPPPDAPEFGQGCKLPPNRVYHIAINTNRTLSIDYQADGFLGRLAAATVQIDEGP